jgi:hydroxyacylglutathione hydrolase
MRMAAEIRLFPCLSDNYGVLMHDSATGATACIDAPQARPILEALSAARWRLTDILVTHHHADHVQGIEAVKAAFPHARVTGPKAEADRIPMIERSVVDGDAIEVGALKGVVIATPGHTAGHVVYHFPGEALLFSGDTLFAMGCGRAFEAPAETLWESLSKLKRLPADTTIYCGHEYTLANARFCADIEPGNAALEARLAAVEALRARDAPTLPTTLAQELATNSFLRADQASVKQSVGMADQTDAAVFAEIRARKNRS